MKRRFFTLDVFTQTKFAGNPLAVVLESEELDTAAMQAIAREFNHPETVFVFRPREEKNLAALRIFTPAAELPFAGHPTVGAAVLLAILDGADAPREFALEEKIGNVFCRFEPKTGDTGHVRFTIPSLPVDAGTLPKKNEIAAALSLKSGDIGFDDASPSRWSGGNAFSFVPLKNLDAMARCRPAESFETVFGIDGPGMVYLFCKETADPGNDFHARMFAPLRGVPEDPATGSAAAAFAGLLAASGRYRDGEHTFRIEQGYEMGRPSLIELGLWMRDGRLTSANVGGYAVIVTEGSIAA